MFLGLRTLGYAITAGCVLGISSARADGPVKARTITMVGEDLVLALKLDKAIQNVSVPVTKCVNSGVPVGECQCRSKAAIMQFRDVAGQVLKQRPEWNAEDIVLYWETSDKEHPVVSHNLVLKAMGKAMNDAVRGCSS